MESSRAPLLFALIVTLAIFHLVQAQDQEGFISLDCGLSPNEGSSYTEPVTGLRYQSDANFIQSGTIGTANRSLETKFLKPSTTLRFFPEGIRNCYNLTVQQGTRNLIRARFLYGNYDGRNIYPKFDLHLGPNLWQTIELGPPYGALWVEISHTATSNLLDVCLIRTDTTLTPFISVLELRPLPNNSYITTAGSLKTLDRWYSSSLDAGLIRFPKDEYDRLWYPYIQPDWKQISTSFTVNTSDNFRLPQAVLTTAAIPVNGSAPLIDYEETYSSQDRVYMYFHFCEVQALRANESREFDILINGDSVTDSYSPQYLQSKTVNNQFPVICEGKECIVELSKSGNSTHPPMFNAVEVFAVADFQQFETYENDVLAIKSIKTTYELSRITWQGDPCAPRNFLWDGLNCTNVDNHTPPRITLLDLSSSGLTGTIAVEIQNLTSLEKLDLSNNKLVGGVPEFLANMKSLMFINLSKNDMNGTIPQALRDRQKKGMKLFVDGDENNPCLSGSCDAKKKFPVMIVALVASAAVVVLVVLALFCVFRKKKAMSHLKAIPPSPTTRMANLTSTSISETSIETTRKKFTYSEVMQMTKNFQKALGEGGFGIVYHGVLDGSQQVELLLRVHHINLVNLVGYCDERDHLALIYEYMSNVDLKHHLSGKHGGAILNWSTRLQIVVDAALGLEYLHIGCRPSMVHRDVKSTNILLDENFKAKIADFGLSRSFQNKSQVSTVIAGTPGYLDPEYYRTGRLAEMSDVYSFGIVLLEIITNQRVIDQSREKPHITEWAAYMLNRGDITSIMDPNLNGDYISHSVWKALELAMLCANPTSEKRPSMSQVVVELKECLIYEKSMRSKNPDMDSQSSNELSMSFNTNDVPRAR